MNIRFWSHRLWATGCVTAILLASLMWAGGRRFTDVSAVRAADGLFSSYAPFWSVSRGFSSTLVLRNRQQSSLVATPVIYTTGGKETRLDTIELQPGATEMVLLDTALAAAGVSAETGALSVEYAQPAPPLVGGEVVVRNDEQSLIFNFPLDAGFVGAESKTVQAAWWFPDEETSATVVLFNASSEKVVVHPLVSVNGAARAFADVTLEPHEQQVMDLKKNLRDSGLHDAPLGLLTLSYDGPVNAFHPALLLSNEKTGFSLTGKFLPKREAQPNEQTTWHFPAVFANRPSDEWGFKKGVTFTPYALLGNTTSNFIALDLEAGDTEPGGSIVQSVNLPISPLAPQETRLVDLSEYIKHGLLSDKAGSLSVRLSYAGAAGDLTVQVFSADKSRNFVFAAEGRMHPARAFEPLSWDIAGDRMSAIDVRNISPGDVQVRVTLTYNHGQGSYRAPLVALRGSESRMVNVKELVRASQQTSAEGAIPAGVTFGGAVIEAVGGQSDAPLVVASSVFDPVRGTCGATPSCSTQDATVLLDGFALPTCDSLCPITSPCADCSLIDPPTIAQVSPSRGLIGDSVVVTITGSSFGSNPSVIVAGDGITLNITSKSSTKITVTFAISANATGANHEVTVTSSGLTSAPVNFFVQIPTSLSLSMGALRIHNGSSITDCNGQTVVPIAFGYSRLLTYTVLDQEGTPIRRAGMAADENVTVVSTNITNVSSNSVILSSAPTNAQGEFCDIQALFSTVSPLPAGVFLKLKQSIHIGFAGRHDVVRFNCVDKESNDVTMTDITNDPAATCQ